VAGRLGDTIREIRIEFPDCAAGKSTLNVRIQLEAAARVFDVRKRHRALTPADRASPG
jgi:hypothetical protein